MKILFTKSEYHILKILCDRVNIPAEKLGITEQSPSMVISPEVTKPIMHTALSELTDFKARVVHNKIMEYLRMLPAGCLRKK